MTIDTCNSGTEDQPSLRHPRYEPRLLRPVLNKTGVLGVRLVGGKAVDNKYLYRSI